MGIVLSIFTIAAGAFVALNGGDTSNGARPDSAGLVLVGAGLLWLVLSLMIANAYDDPQPRGQRVVHLRGARPGERERRT